MSAVCSECGVLLDGPHRVGCSETAPTDDGLRAWIVEHAGHHLVYGSTATPDGLTCFSHASDPPPFYPFALSAATARAERAEAVVAAAKASIKADRAWIESGYVGGGAKADEAWRVLAAAVDALEAEAAP